MRAQTDLYTAQTNFGSRPSDANNLIALPIPPTLSTELYLRVSVGHSTQILDNDFIKPNL